MDVLTRGDRTDSAIASGVFRIRARRAPSTTSAGGRSQHMPSSGQRTPPAFRHSTFETGVQRRSSASGPSAEKEKELPSCKNCMLHTPAPYLHSFSTPLDQCKNQSWQTSNNGWIVTPTSSAGGTAAMAESAFCSGDCLFSYLFSHDLLSSQKADDALHFFKRVDTQRTTDRWADATGRATGWSSAADATGGRDLSPGGER